MGCVLTNMKLKSSRLRRWLRRFMAAAVAWLLMWYALPWCFPWPEELNAPPAPAAAFTDRDGVPLRRLLENGHRAGEELAINEIPEALVLATLAAEDQRFRSH